MKRTLEQDLFAIFKKKGITVLYIKNRAIKNGILYYITTKMRK